MPNTALRSIGKAIIRVPVIRRSPHQRECNMGRPVPGNPPPLPHGTGTSWPWPRMLRPYTFSNAAAAIAQRNGLNVYDRAKHVKRKETPQSYGDTLFDRDTPQKPPLACVSCGDMPWRLRISRAKDTRTGHKGRAAANVDVTRLQKG